MLVVHEGHGCHRVFRVKAIAVPVSSGPAAGNKARSEPRDLLATLLPRDFNKALHAMKNALGFLQAFLRGIRRREVRGSDV